ncbi:MAG: flagellar export chaperone FlgN [Phycisphaerales bacterium]
MSNAAIDQAELARQQLFAGLEGVLTELVREHERLEALTREHRVAIQKLDQARLKSAITGTAESIQRIARLEERRCQLLKIQPVKPGEKVEGQPSVAEVAELMDEERRGRVLDLAARLRELLEAIRRRHAAIKRASETLSAHMQGLIHQVAAELTGTGTYSRAGRIETGARPAVSGVDVRS